jgi:hypothetical protein
MGNPADLISQNEKREVLRNDRLVRTTYHSVAQAFIDEDRGDRFSVLNNSYRLLPNRQVPQASKRPLV